MYKEILHDTESGRLNGGLRDSVSFSDMDGRAVDLVLGPDITHEQMKVNI